MALILKSKTEKASSGAEVLYKDALVTEGTLLLHDYSNKGNLFDFSLKSGSPVYDLASRAALDLEVNNFTTILENSDPDPTLTPGRGFKVNSLGSNPSPVQNLGIDLGLDLLNYLSTKTSKILLVAWLRLDTSIVANGAFLTSTGDGGGNNYPVRFNVADGAITVSFAGASVQPESMEGDKLIQIGIEYMGTGLPHRKFINGVLVGNGVNNAAGFGTPSTPLVLGKIDSINRGGIMYRWMLEDLNISGRTAESVVKKDWNFCNGIGEYAGKPTKRPFIEVV